MEAFLFYQIAYSQALGQFEFKFLLKMGNTRYILFYRGVSPSGETPSGTTKITPSPQSQICQVLPLRHYLKTCLK